ncbi:MAG: tetratricopeptide repeat protein [Symploca sp. SIO2B6]|nr:tetratricopeptide repeat protein [Symploca sp. SIO2B6]
MALKIDRGLFNTDFTDHHAVLGVPIDASSKDVRKRYLRIARRLHPDSSAITTEAERQLANELLSKLVNPAYEKLTQEKEQAEYALILKLKGQEACNQQETIALTTKAAGQLAGSSNGSYAGIYLSSLQELSKKQYESLSETIDIIGEISELNLVYLMKQAQGGATSPPPKTVTSKSGTDVTKGETNNTSQTATRTTPSTRSPRSKPTREQIIARYLERAKNHEAQGKFLDAIRELRDALKYDPQNGDCHSRLGAIYLRTKQTKMAKVHFQQALKVNPKDPIAQAGLRRLEPKATNASNPSSGKKGTAKGKEKSGGGLFGLFGGKKK